MSFDRLTHALTSGLTLPSEGRILLSGAPGDLDLAGLDPARCEILQRFAPDHDAWTRRGLTTRTAPEGRYAATIVFLPRARDRAEARLAEACAVTDDLVVIDGQKTDGIEAMVKALRPRVTTEGVVSKAHGKMAWFRPDPEALADWAHAPRQLESGIWTAPGIFSADGPDPASEALAEALPRKLGATVADLGAGWAGLAPAVLDRTGVETLHLVEADLDALDCARKNVTDPRTQFHWADATTWAPEGSVDTVVMNPPFHIARKADPGLGQAFIRAAARMLTPQGTLFLVANRHLPYESTLQDTFADVEEIGGNTRFKLITAARPRRARR